MIQRVIDHSINLRNPKYIGHQISVPALPAVLGELVSAYLNNGMAVYEMGQVSTVLERRVIEWLCNKVGYTAGEGFMTSGGTLGTLTALLTSRQVWRSKVLADSPSAAPVILTSQESHYAVARAAFVMGLATEDVIKIAVDAQNKMSIPALRETISSIKTNGKSIMAIVGSACTTATGTYDPLTEIAAICATEDCWFHVDGAHGGAAVISPTHKGLLQGVELADSVVIDFHKMLQVPTLATAVLYQDTDDSYRTFNQRSDYLLPSDEQEWHNIGQRTFECTKEMMSLKIYLLLHLYGEKSLIDFVDKTYALAKSFSTIIQQDEAFELALEPEANIVCFRYVDAEADTKRLIPLIES